MHPNYGSHHPTYFPTYHPTDLPVSFITLCFSKLRRVVVQNHQSFISHFLTRADAHANVYANIHAYLLSH
jgi:hypothetical protein